MTTIKIKKSLDPSQLICAIDTREQTPVNVSPLRSIRSTLTTGDYSIVGLEDVVALERKSLNDLVMCVGRERERFEREIQRLLAYPVRCLVIEACWIDIELQKYRGNVHPNAITGSIIGWMAKGLPIHWAADHAEAGKFISRFLFSAARRRYFESHQFIETIDFTA